MVSRVLARPSPELGRSANPLRPLEEPGGARAARVWSGPPHPGPAQSGHRTLCDLRQVPSPLWASALPPIGEAAQIRSILARTQSPAFVMAGYPLRRTPGVGPTGGHGLARLPLTPAPVRPATPAAPLPRSRKAARREGERAREGGEEAGAEASVDRGGLLVHYKITKNKWKTIKGFKSK